jgi:salicylate hydroxylase
VGFSQDASGVTLHLKDGSREAGDALIGADGVGSSIRSCLHPDESPARPSGYCAVRGVAYGAGGYLGSLSAVGYLDDGIEAATARAGRDGVYWYLSLLARELPADSRSPQVILNRLLPSMDGPLRAILAATAPDDIRFDELVVRDPLMSWGAGRVTLLGDAAHPMLPHLGQGANQSIEDGMALATILAQADRQTAPAALLAYERLRRERVAQIQQGARASGLRYNSAYSDLGLRDAEIAAHAAFRRTLYDHDVIPEAQAAAAALG